MTAGTFLLWALTAALSISLITLPVSVETQLISVALILVAMAVIKGLKLSGNWRLVALALGTVTSWKQLLTTVPPVAASDGHLIVPFILTLVGGVLTGSLALRARHAAWALLPAAVVLVATILLGFAIQPLMSAGAALRRWLAPARPG